MLKNKMIVKKIRNIVILLMAMIIMFGAYKNIDRSRAEDVIEIGAIAIDNYGYLEKENFILEAQQIDDDIYEIELPESVNGKKINQIIKVTLEDIVPEVITDNAVIENASTENEVAETTGEQQPEAQQEPTPEPEQQPEAQPEPAPEQAPEAETTPAPEPAPEQTPEATPETVKNLEIKENKIQISKEQLDDDNKQINIEVVYDVAILEKNQEGLYQKNILAEKSEEERQQIEITEETEMLYGKILRHEDEENKKLVELKGYLPVDAELQVEEVTQEKITEIFGEKKINVAYDIKIIRKVVTQVPVDEANPESEVEEIVEIIEINPEEFGEKCEVTITDANIAEKSQVYHVKEDNTYEEVNVNESTKGNVNFEAQTFSIYAVGEEIVPEEGTETGAPAGAPTISLNGINVTTTTTTYTKDIPLSYYGGEITNYVSNTDTGEEWDIFHSDGENIYLIADGCIPYSVLPTSGANISKIGTYTFKFSGNPSYNITDVKNSPAKKWVQKFLNSYGSSTNSSMRIVGYFLNTSLWSKFTDSDGSGFADWVVGAPPIELYAASYNKYHSGTDSLSLSVNSTGYTGWASKWLEYGPNGIHYRSNMVGDAEAWWIAGPSSGGEAYTYYIAEGGQIGHNQWNANTKRGTRPIVCLKSEYTVIPDGSKYKIVPVQSGSAGSSASSVKDHTYKNKHDITVTINDSTGLSSSSELYYAWGTSNTEPPTGGAAIISSSLNTITNGSKSKTVTISGRGSVDAGNVPETGIRYLWLLANLKDTSGNTNTDVVTTGAFYFDNGLPTLLSTDIEQDGLLASFDADHNVENGHSNSTTTWKELSGATDGKLTGGTWASNYLTLDGEDDWVNLGEVNLTNKLTAEATVEYQSFSGDPMLIGNWNEGGFALYTSSGKPKLGVYIAEQGGYKYASSNETLSTGRKYHIAGTYDGSTIKLYVDGVLKAQTSASGTIKAPINNGVVAIGTTTNGSVRNGVVCAKMKVYSARVYNTALTQAQIQSNKAATSATSVVTTGLIRNLDANDNTGAGHSNLVTRWKDLSGSANGKITGGTWSEDRLTLDGVDDWVNLGQINVNKTVTVEAVVTLDQLPSSASYIISNMNTGGYGLVMTSGGYPRMQIYSAEARANKNATSTEALVPGQMYHIAGTYDGTTIKLYVNGVLKAQTSVSGTIKAPNNNTVVAIGCGPSGSSASSGFLKMNIYLASIYNKALTQAQLSSNINSELEGRTWKKTHNVTVTATEELSGLASGAQIKYGWSTSRTTPPSESSLATATLSYTAGASSTTFTATGTGIDGKYYLWVIPTPLKDKAGNSAIPRVSLRRYWFDSTSPEIELPNGGNTTWQKTHNVTVTLKDTPSGLASGNTVKYGWSTSNTTAPSESNLTTATLSYTNGAASTTFTATGSGLTGRYYLWVVPTTFNDVAGNSNTTSVVSAGQYYFDNTPAYWTAGTPTINANKTVTVELTGTDDHSGYASNSLDPTDISIYVDGVLTNAKATLSNATSITNGVKYTLTISDIVEAVRRQGKQYKEWSGTIEVKVAANTITDAAGNVNAEYDVNIGLVDLIKPEIDYTHSTSDIDKTNNKYTMTFTVTDKYVANNTLTLNDLTITMRNGQLDGNGDEKVYSLKSELPSGSITLTPAEIKVNTSVTNATTGAVEAVTNHVIGYTYTLEINNLDRLVTEDGNKTVNYSGIFEVEIPAGKIADRTGNTNSLTKITSGISITDGVQSGTATVVDVVNPVWEKVESSALAKLPSEEVNATATTGTATLTIKGTDTYLNATDATNSYDSSTLTSDEIEIYIDGVKNTTIVPTITKTDTLSENRNVYGSETTESVQYGVEYTITVNGWVQNANQVKVKILADAIKDKSGNGNKETDFLVYNVIVKADNTFTRYKYDANGTTVLNEIYTGGLASGDSSDATGYGNANFDVNGDGKNDYVRLNGFLKESPETRTVYKGGSTFIDRRQIGKIVFVDSLEGAEASDVNRVWDVSAQKDGSILAWVVGSSWNNVIIYIGSEHEIFANQDSSYLFYYLGTITGSAEALENIELLNTSSVTNMYGMFWSFGTTAMTSLDLGDNFDTSNVTNMSNMFYYCGYNAMTTLTLPETFDTSNVTTMSGMFESCGYTAMTTLTLPEAFDTSKVTTMERMFIRCGYTAMTTLTLPETFDTSNVTGMTHMFNRCGYTAMTKLDLSVAKFNTSNVTSMSGMFSHCGYTAMTELNLGNQFDTTKVSSMGGMFEGCGYTALIELDLGDNFNTRGAQDMGSMFQNCGYTAMTKLDLGDKFNVNGVRYDGSWSSLNNMFQNCGYTSLTSLDLGDQFDTRNVKDGKMNNMFDGCGALSMTELDLGPAFVKISNGSTDFMRNTGKAGELTVYAPEAIYSSQTSLKLNSADTTTVITPQTVTFDGSGNVTSTADRGQTIIPQYKPEFEKVETVVDTENETITVTIKGTAYQTEEVQVEVDNGDGTTSTELQTVPTYIGTLTGRQLLPQDITIYFDGVEVTSITNPQIVVNTGIPTTNEDGATEIPYTILLSNLKEAIRQAGVPYKEWSGNIAIQIAGRGQDTSTYTANVLVDQYGNQNMFETDEGQTVGTWIDIKIEDTATDINTEGVLFADFIKPEFTYEYSNTIIGDGNHGDTKTVTIVFDVTDKYFASTTLSNLDASQITVMVDDYSVTELNEYLNTNNHKQLTKLKDVYYDRTAGTTYVNSGATGTGRKVGERYQLVVSGLDQGDAYKYSGPMTLGFSAGAITDKSGNTSPATAITIGFDEKGQDPYDFSTIEYTKPYLPKGYSYVIGTDLSNGLTIEDDLGNQYVWVEVPRTLGVYETSGLGITQFTDADYTKIENDLRKYTSAYGEEGFTDTWSYQSATGLTEEQYYTKKKKMLKSIYKNGGFYIGKYETGIADTEPNVIDTTVEGRAEGDAITQTPVIQANAYPYNWLINNQAQALAMSFATTGYETNLLFGVQWDLTLKYLENSGAATQDELKTNSTNWGNHTTNTTTNITNTKAKYLDTTGTNVWTDGAYGQKTSSKNVILSTGASDDFAKMGIYDLAGNMQEYTLEKTNVDNPITRRGTSYSYNGKDGADFRLQAWPTGAWGYVGFRVSLYKDEGIGADGEIETNEYTTPYLPTGYTHVVGTDLSSGLTIKDSLGNEFVWIEVPKNLYDNASYNTETTTGDRKPTSSEDYENIEYCLHKYTATYRNGTTFEDTWYSEEQHGFASSDDYNDFKNKMLKSVYENGGFYVGKYETGIADTQPDVVDSNHEARTAAGATTQTPVIQANAYPYNYVTNKQAQDLAKSFATTGYETSLMFGVQWDLILKHLETKQFATVSELNSNSKEWGNSLDNTTYTTNANGKYYKSSWTDGQYNKTTEESVLLSTGASTEFERGGIYDLAGNVLEFTLESYESESKCIVRGGRYNWPGEHGMASRRVEIDYSNKNENYGFRVMLFKNETPEVVDVVDPIWQLGVVSLDTGTIKVIATDKYYKASELDEDDITLILEGTELTNLTITGPVEIVKDEKYEYTISLEDAIAGGGQGGGVGTGTNTYTEFIPLDPIVGTTAKYRNSMFQQGEELQIEIAAETIEDNSGNKNEVATFSVGEDMGDDMGVEIFDVDKIQDAGANTLTLIFNATDKYYDPTDLITKEELTLKIDNQELPQLLENATFSSIPIRTMMNDVETIVGHQYTLVISNIAETVRQLGKEYLEWTGTVELEIDEQASKDTNGNFINTRTSTITDFVDYIKPTIEYTHSSTDIDKTDKKYTMTFKVTDKYYTSGELTLNDLTISMTNGQVDESGNLKTYNLKTELPSGSISLRPTPIKVTANVTDSITGVVGEVAEHTIGHTYTLTIENLEQLEIANGNTTANYSGVITVEVAPNKVLDRKGNGNATTTITSGVDITTDGLPRTQYTMPYLPEGASYLEGDLSSGLVIKDDSGNEYVWIEVPRSLYSASTLALDLDSLTGDDLTAAYETIEDEMNEYSEYHINTSIDEYPEDIVEAKTGLTSKQYTKLKQKMLKSVFTYGGFYVGRYETGIADTDPDVNEWRTSAENDIDNYIPVIQKNAYPYNYVTLAQAQEVASGEHLAIDGYQTSLMFGLQYELILTYIQEKAVEGLSGEEYDRALEQIMSENFTDSSSWANYKYSTWSIENENAKYMTSRDNWTNGVNMSKASGQAALLSSGASEIFKKQNIYDLPGNCNEWTLEHITTNLESPSAYKGGSAGTSDVGSALKTWRTTGLESNNIIGFRVSLFKEAGKAIDVVDPLWSREESSANAIYYETVVDPDTGEETEVRTSKATITFTGTDTYFEESTLTIDDIQVIVNGVLDGDTNGNGVIDAGETPTVTKTLDSTTQLKEERLINGVSTPNVQYGVKYSITLKGFAEDANQVKIRIPAGKMTDTNGNASKETDLILYNVLVRDDFIPEKYKYNEDGTEVLNEKWTGELAAGDANASFTTSFDVDGDGKYDYISAAPFLKESPESQILHKSGIELLDRRFIEKVIFVDSIEASKDSGVQRIFDVSAQRDGSILAWTYDTGNWTTTVYIGSEYEIFANQDSSNLFKTLGRLPEIATATEALENIELLNTSSVIKMTSMFEEFGYASMTSFDLGDNFDTSNVTNMSLMFKGCGYTAMTSLDLGKSFDTSNVTNMSYMFMECGYTAMTSLDLSSGTDLTNITQFNTRNVTEMYAMFYKCGYTAMTTLNLGRNFNTNNVINMGRMFSECGYTALTSLDLGEKFNTSNVTNMWKMFNGCGYTAMTELKLGDKFDTKNVLEMDAMFQNCGYTALTTLDLGDKFDTKKVQNGNMTDMFDGTGATAMTILDLGPAFVKIASGSTDFMRNTGKAGELTIYAPESIYSSQTSLKLNSADTTTVITPQTVEFDGSGNPISTADRGQKIIPIYKPGWTKVSTTLNKDETNIDNSTISVQIKGTASHTQTLAGGAVKINYTNNNLTSNLIPEDIIVYINGREATWITKTITPVSPVTGGEITQTVTLSNFKETSRQLGLPYTEWSGNIAIKVKGRGQATSTYTENVLVDQYGNQNMFQTDENQTPGTWIDLKFEEATQTDRNTAGVMFADFIKPEFTYVYATGTIIDPINKKVTIVFDVADKYFASSTLDASHLTATIDDLDMTVTSLTSTDIPGTGDRAGQTVGKRYTLELTTTEATGIIRVEIPAGKVSDTSGNQNNAQLIIVGVDIPTPEGEEIGDGEIIDLTNPTITVTPEFTTNAVADGFVTQQNVTIGVVDDYSNLSTSNEYQYYLSSSPTELLGGEWKDYTDNGEYTLGTGLTGEYYLFIKRIEDRMGNKSSLNGAIITVDGTKYHRFGPYKFDNTAPNESSLTMLLGDSTGPSYTGTTSGTTFTGDLTNQNVYIEPIGTDEHSGIASVTYTVNGGSGVTAAQTLSPANGSEQTYTVRVTATDKVGNTRTSDTYIIRIDKIKPTWEYVSKDIYLTNPNDVGNDDYANADRTVKIVFKGTDTNNHDVTSTLTSNAITVSVNGDEVLDKELVTVDNGTEVTCTLTITGITGDGVLNVELPGETLTDEASNKNDTTNITTNVNITIDNTNPTVDFAVISPAAGGYKAGQEVKITATYNENMYKEVTSNNLIDTTAEAPTMTISFGNQAAKTAVCESVDGKVITYKYTIADGDNGLLRINSLGIVYDEAGNGVELSTIFTPSIEIKADTTLPTIEVTPDHTTNAVANDYVATQEITITATDEVVNEYASGVLGGSGAYEYFLSESETPTAVPTDALVSGTYINGSSFTIGTDLTGTYYLFVKVVSDGVGNISEEDGTIVTVAGTKYHKFGTFKFDNTTPNESYLTMLIGDASGVEYTGTTSGTTFTGNWTNQNVYIAPNGDDEHSGIKSITYTVNAGTPTSTAQTLSPADETEVVYTVVVTIEDNVGNITTSGDYIIRIDKINPTITSIEANKTSYTNSEQILYTITFSEDVTGFEADDITLTSTQNKATKGTFTAQSATVYTLVVNTVDGYVETVNVNVPVDKAIDKAGNGNVVSSTNTLEVDRKDPTITATPDKTTNATANDYQKTQNVTITVEDEGAGLLPSNSYQYFLSSSATALAGGAWTGGTWTDYTSGTPFTIGTGLTGDYYLFVKTVQDNVTDSVKNESNTLGTMTTVDGTTYHMFGTFKFDNTNPYWIVGTPTMDYTDDDAVVEIIGTDDHSGYKANTLDIGDIEVWVDGTKITNVTKHLNTGETVAEGIKYTLTLSTFAEDVRQLGKSFKEWSGSTEIVILANSLEDNLSNQNVSDDFTLGHIDLVNPEFTYEYANTSIVKGDTEIVTVIFDVTDKFFGSTTLSTLNASQITVSVDDYDVTELNTYLNSGSRKVLTKIKDVYYDTTAGTTYLTPGATGTGTKVGERYQLVLSGLDQEDGYKYSGYMTLSFAAGVITDTSTNTSGALAITIGKDDVDGNPGQDTAGDGEVVDVVDPIWELGTVNLDAGTIKLITKDKYFNNSTIDEDDITVLVNGIPSSTVGKDISSITPTDIKETVNGVPNTVVGKEYTLQLSNITPAGGGYTEFTPTNLVLDSLNNTAGFKYKSENGGSITLQIAAGVTTDASGNGNNVTDLPVGNIDMSGPEIYEVQKIQNASANTETIIFNVTDRNYDSTDLVQLNEITLWFDNVQLDTLRNGATLTQKEIKLDIDGVAGKVLGHQYTLVIPNIAETTKQDGKSYLEYSGTLKMTVATNAAKDIKGNTLNSATTTITDFIDYLKPQMEQVTVATPINTSAKTYTMSFKVIDKYLYNANVADIDMITGDEITVYVDGEEASSITKTLTSTPITATMNKTVNGVVTSVTNTIGHTYTLVLGGFEQGSKQGGKKFIEWSGTVKAVINSNATSDTTGNTLDTDETKRTLTGEHVDFIKPVLEKVSSARGTNDETIIFNVMDKYLANSDTDVISKNEIIVYVDGEPVTVDYTNSSSTGLNGVLTKVQNFTHTVNGDSSHIVGQQYQLVLSGFEQASRNAKDYKDYSGTVTMEITQNAVADTKGNTLDAAVAKRTVKADFVDFIKPQLEYTHSSSDINHGTKTYTMTFDVTDKYYDDELANNVLTLADLTITMDSEYSSVNDFDLKALANQGKLNISLSDSEKTATFNKTVDGEVEETATSHVIGHTYTLTISNLDQLEIASGDKTVNYSGIITVKVAQNQISDRGPAGDGTMPNKNVETQMVSGVNVPGGSGSGVVVDVVSPLFDKVSSSAYAFNPSNKTSSIGTIEFKATDRYFVEGSGITENDIQVVVDGTVVSTGITKTFTDTEVLTEDRIISGVEQDDVQYGVKYTLQITGWAQNAHQVKIRIPAEKLTDQYGNKNIETDLIVYNCLELTSSEVGANSGFLGNTNIDRQDVHNVTFLSNVSGAPRDGDGNIDIDNDVCWDVSARNDKSIIAWRTASVPYTVYIGSKDEIFANQNSTCLFAYIGHGSSSTATETITNISSLNVRSVTNMTSMFEGCGADAMTTFTLGSNFNTSNVTKMGSMFKKFGKSQLASLSLGTQFITNEVTDMSSMFEECGTNAMTSLILGSNFNTTKVTTMDSMFKNCTPKITSIDLGTQFDTSIVTDMGSMFEGFGATSLTSLDLGNLFFTNKVTVTDMNNMFNGCGTTAMTVLDLGPAFTKISSSHTDFMKDCGKSTLVIYAPESIYLDRTTLKTN